MYITFGMKIPSAIITILLLIILLHFALCDLEIASSRNTSSPTVFCSEEQIYFRCISNQTQLKWYLNGQVHFNFGRCLDIKCDADFYIKQTPDLCYASFFPEVNMSIFYILSATNNDTIGCNDQSIEITVLKGLPTIPEVQTCVNHTTAGTLNISLIPHDFVKYYEITTFYEDGKNFTTLFTDSNILLRPSSISMMPTIEIKIMNLCNEHSSMCYNLKNCTNSSSISETTKNNNIHFMLLATFFSILFSY